MSNESAGGWLRPLGARVETADSVPRLQETDIVGSQELADPAQSVVERRRERLVQEPASERRQQLLESETVAEIGRASSPLVEEASDAHERHPHDREVGLHRNQALGRWQYRERPVSQAGFVGRDQRGREQRRTRSANAKPERSPEIQREQHHRRCRRQAGNRRRPAIAEHPNRGAHDTRRKPAQLDGSPRRGPAPTGQRTDAAHEERHDAELGQHIAEGARPPDGPVVVAFEQMHDGGVGE